MPKTRRLVQFRSRNREIVQRCRSNAHLGPFERHRVQNMSHRIDPSIFWKNKNAVEFSPGHGKADAGLLLDLDQYMCAFKALFARLPAKNTKTTPETGGF